MANKHYTLSDVLSFARERGIEGTAQEKIQAYLDWKYPKEGKPKDGKQERQKNTNITLIVWNGKHVQIHSNQPNNRYNLMFMAMEIAEKMIAASPVKNKLKLEDFSFMFAESENLLEAMTTERKPKGRQKEIYNLPPEDENNTNS